MRPVSKSLRSIFFLLAHFLTRRHAKLNCVSKSMLYHPTTNDNVTVVVQVQ